MRANRVATPTTWPWARALRREYGSLPEARLHEMVERSVLCLRGGGRRTKQPRERIARTEIDNATIKIFSIRADQTESAPTLIFAGATDHMSVWRDGRGRVTKRWTGTTDPKHREDRCQIQGRWAPPLRATGASCASCGRPRHHRSCPTVSIGRLERPVCRYSHRSRTAAPTVGCVIAVAGNDESVPTTHRTAARSRVFEIATPTAAAEPATLPDEREIVAIALAGTPAPGAVAVLDELFAALAIDGLGLTPAERPGLHPSRTAVVTANGADVGVVGEVDPDVATAYSITERVAWLALDLPAVLAHPHGLRPYRRVSRFPSSDIDLAFVRRVRCGHSMSKPRSGGRRVSCRSRLFDVFRGASVPQGSRSLAYSLRCGRRADADEGNGRGAVSGSSTRSRATTLRGCGAERSRPCRFLSTSKLKPRSRVDCESGNLTLTSGWPAPRAPDVGQAPHPPAPSVPCRPRVSAPPRNFERCSRTAAALMGT